MTDQVEFTPKYGWNAQRPDNRDRPLMLAPNIDLPRHVDRHGECPPIWNQGNLGSCTAHATLRAYCHMRKRAGQHVFMPSRLLQYYDSRALEGTTWIDAGATTRDAIRATARWGACDESLWPYDISKFNRKPPNNAYEEAAKHQSLVYQAVPQDLYSLKATLASGYVIVFGFTVYSNFEHTGGVARTGMMEMPAGHVVGGHCCCLVGYNSHNLFLTANSWSTRWGDPDLPGHFWFLPEYLTNPNLATDFWCIRSIET